VDDKRKRIVRQKVEPIDLGAHQTFIPHVSLLQEKLIGRAIVEFSRLEQALSHMIWHLLKLQMKDGRLITTRMDAQTKIAMLYVLVPRYFDTAKQRAALAVLDVAEIIREDRNFIAHGLWGTLMPDNVPMVASVRPKSDPDNIISEAFPAERMRSIISSTKKMTGILRHLSGAPDAWRGK
jgi:hypothetical protein